MKIFISLVLSLICCPSFLLAQQEALSLDDYKRAVTFTWANYNNKTAFNLRTRTNWFDDNSGMWYLNHALGKKTFKKIDFTGYRISDLFRHQELAQSLEELTGDSITAQQLPFDYIEKIGFDSIQFNYKGTEYGYDNQKNKVFKIEKEEEESSSSLNTSSSPDGKWIAYTKDYNLYIKSIEEEKEYQLSFNGTKDYVYGSWYGWFDKMEGENGARPERFSVTWSEDSKWLATNICDTRYANKMYLLDWSQDTAYRPSLWSYYRGSPGDTNMVHLQPVFYNIENKKEVKTNLPRNTHINSVRRTWSKESGVLYANYAERGYQKEYVLKLDLNKNTSQVLIEEESKTNIDNFSYWIEEDLGKILFLSERSGWRQLYAYDLKTNQTSAMTKGEYYVHDIKHVDQEKGMIFYTAAGKDKNMNPYYQQLYRIDLNGELKLLTPEPAHHVVSFSPNGNFFSDNYSTLTQATQTVFRLSSTGNAVAQLTKASLDPGVFKDWKAPETFELIGKDGQSKIHGALWKPTNFDPSKKYPIVDHTYTGPHTQVVPKSFDRIFTNQALAELGFIVVMVDGLGTAGRSKAFHDHSYKNMGNNLEDHVLAIRHLGKQFSWIDTTRVGIFGHSAGGFDTGHALLAFPDFYKVGVASSADHDFRMEKAWWPEMYMGWPVDDSYEAVSNITMAPNLKGKLLLVHGAMDDNVNPSATFKLAEALVKADKDFDLLIFPSQRHGYQGNFRRYFIKKRWNYFVEHLRGAKPIWDFKWEMN